MKEKRNGTVCFMINKSKVLLALIKYPDGVKRWNGIGGFVEDGESLDKALIREIDEEIGVKIKRSELLKVDKIDRYPGLILHVFLVKEFNGKPQILDSSIEVFRWFKFNEIPYDEMWEGNEKWLPKIINNYTDSL